LLEWCHQRSDACLGYIAGVSDTIDAVQSQGETVVGWRSCSPKQVTGIQVKDVVVRFLTGHPEVRHLTAASLTARALAEAFPCPPK
jgi:hypothetical protein